MSILVHGFNIGNPILAVSDGFKVSGREERSIVLNIIAIHEPGLFAAVCTFRDRNFILEHESESYTYIVWSRYRRKKLKIHVESSGTGLNQFTLLLKGH